MPLTPAQRLYFANARKPSQNYVDKLGLNTIIAVFNASAANLTRLVTAFYPDQLYSLRRDLTTVQMN